MHGPWESDNDATFFGSAMVTGLVLALVLTLVFFSLFGCTPSPRDPDVPVTVAHACLMDDRTTIYSEITIYQAGWYSTYYFDGQHTEWKWYAPWITLASLHPGGYREMYAVEDPTNDDDLPVEARDGLLWPIDPNVGPYCSART